MQLSYWEQKSFFTAVDAVVVGSGIVGLHAAIHLKKKKPGWHIVILERGFLPYGASTRNAGFACFGSAGELLDDLLHMPEDAVFSLVERRFQGLQKLRLGLGDDLLDYEPLGGYEVFSADETDHFEVCAEKLSWLNQQIKPITGKSETYVLAKPAIAKNGLQGFNACIKNTCEGQVDTGKMMFHLLQKARNYGVVILNGIGVLTVEENNYTVEITTNQGFSFGAKKILITTNGFAKQLLPELEVHPARAQVLITSEIPGLKLKGAFHADRGFYYFRNVGNRILFGGGRNLDFKSEETTDFGITDLVQNRLENWLLENIIPGFQFTIEQRWSGIMGIAHTKSTIIKRVSENISCAVRMGGMGVAIGSLVGEEGASLLLE